MFSNKSMSRALKKLFLPRQESSHFGLAIWLLYNLVRLRLIIFNIYFLTIQVCIMIHSGSRGLGHQVATGE